MFGRLEAYLALRPVGFESSSARTPICRRKPRRVYILSMCKYLTGAGLANELIYLQIHRKTSQEIISASVQFVHFHQ